MCGSTTDFRQTAISLTWTELSAVAAAMMATLAEATCRDSSILKCSESDGAPSGSFIEVSLETRLEEQKTTNCA
jgi:hypothetical protein